MSKTGIDLVAERLSYPTGKVDICIDSEGVANYQFNENCAWDHLSLTSELITLSQEADLIAFGTLAQRNEVSKNTIYKALEIKRRAAKSYLTSTFKSRFL